MIPSVPDDQKGPPGIQGEQSAFYSLEVLARLTGVDADTVLEYHECGLLQPVPGDHPALAFDDESLRRLRRLETVRTVGGMNMTGLGLVARLLDEIEELHERLRRQT